MAPLFMVSLPPVCSSSFKAALVARREVRTAQLKARWDWVAAWLLLSPLPMSSPGSWKVLMGPAWESMAP